jgi:hypothetical protein
MSAAIPAVCLSGAFNIEDSYGDLDYPFETRRWRAPAVAVDADMPPPSNPPAAPPLFGPPITLRDFFAAFALSGILSGGVISEDSAADCAYAYADAMLRRRRAPAQVIH